MNPHKLFLLFLACSAVVSVTAFLENTSEIASMLQILAIAGMAIAVVLFLTRKYWQNARRISSN